MKSHILLLLMLFTFSFPAIAQQDDDFCNPDLSNAIAALESLPAEQEGLFTRLTQIIIELEDIYASCISQVKQYTKDDFTISYPTDWIEQTVDGYSVVTLATSQEAIENLSSMLIHSEELILIVYIDMEDYFQIEPQGSNPLTQLADFIVEEYTEGMPNDIFNDPEAILINDHEAIRVSFQTPTIDSSFIIVSLKEDTYTMFVSVAAHGEGNFFEPTFMQIIESAQFNGN